MPSYMPNWQMNQAMWSIFDKRFHVTDFWKIGGCPRRRITWRECWSKPDISYRYHAVSAPAFYNDVLRSFGCDIHQLHGAVEAERNVIGNGGLLARCMLNVSRHRRMRARPVLHIWPSPPDGSHCRAVSKPRDGLTILLRRVLR